MLAAARELFAADGVHVPLDEIARRAGVGAGTVHRHFPTKNALLTEIVLSDLRRRLEQARTEARATSPGEALFALLLGLLDDGLENAALKASLAESGIDLAATRTDAHDELDALLGDLVRGAQRAGEIRADVDAGDVKAVLAAALAAQTHGAVSAARVPHVRGVILDSLRPR